MTELRRYNPEGFDAFTYGVDIIKATSNKEYNVNAFVDDLSVWESLFAKSMQAKLMLTDGAGLMDQIALQPGDKVRIVAFKGVEAEKKLDKVFEIMSIQMGSQAVNKQGRSYNLSCVTMPAILNKISVVSKSLSGKLSEMAATVAKDYLKIDDEILETEETDGDKKNVVMPGYKPFKMLQWLANHAVSVAHGESNSFYLFYEDRDGFRFKSLKSIISDATHHEYTMTGDDTRFGGKDDVFRIISFQQNRIGSNASRLDNGMLENELLEFDVLGRKMSSKRFDFSQQGDSIRLINTSGVMDIANNFEELRGAPADTRARGILGALKIRSSEEGFDETNTYGRKHGSLIAQKTMFNQLSYTFTMGGNPGMKAGDLIVVNAAALSADDQRELDPYLNGLFLIANVRHKITAASEFITVIDVFKDGYDSEYTPKEGK
jgi:hypothetical protein